MNNFSITKDSDQRRRDLSVMVGVIVSIVLVITLLDIGYLTYQMKKSSLLDKVSSQKELIEAVGRFNSENSERDNFEGSLAATLSEVVDAVARTDHTGSNELVLAEQRGDKIVFIVSRYAESGKGLDVSSSKYDLLISEHSTDLTSPAAEPMRRAFNGMTGTVMGKDYHKTYVLAAHTPITIGGHPFGLVAKIDLADFLGPLLRASVVAIIIAAILIAIGVKRFLRLVDPIIRELKDEVNANDTMIETSPSGIIIVEEDGAIIRFNNRAALLFGYDHKEVIGKNVSMLMPVELERKESCGDPNHQKTGINKHDESGREMMGERKDGSRFPLHLAIGEMDIGGQIQFVEIITDITARKEAEKDILQKDRVIEESPVGVIITDTEGKMEYINPASLRIHGYNEAEEVIGNTPNMFRSGQTPPEIYSAMWEHLKAGKQWTGDLVNKRKDGTTVWVRQYLFPVRQEDGVVEHYVSIQEDVTELRAYRENLESTVKQRTAELEVARDAAEMAARSKSMFLANMSHEIRTPMNAIIGFSDILLQTKLAQDQRKHLGTVNRSARSLLTLLNDILDIAKLEEGRITLEIIPFSLPQLLDDILATMSIKSMEKAIELDFTLADDLPHCFSGDPTRLRQVLVNLLGNAIKFTSQGKVSIHVERHENNFLHFLVMDTGIGIPADRIDSIFEAFNQADISTTRKHGGTGLGTTISKQFVELMGGKIWIESVVNEGSTFHFTAGFPDADCSDIVTINSNAQSHVWEWRSLSILLAEDIQENVELATLRLTSVGHRVTHAENGKEALRLVKEQGPFDVVLMDIQMPVMDGEEASRQIRLYESTSGARRLPIIALTASVMFEERERYISAGMDGMVGKPIDFVELFSTIGKLIRNGESILSDGISGVADSAAVFPKLAGVDTEKGLATWHDHNIYRRNLVSFANSHKNDAQLMHEVLAKNDIAMAKKMAHTLKGVAGNLAVTAVARIATELNNASAKEWLTSSEVIGDLNSALREAADSIATLRESNANDEKKVIQFDSSALEEKCEALAGNLTSGNPKQRDVDDVIKHLRGHIDEKLLDDLTGAINDFDFDTAEDTLRKISSSLNLKWIKK